MDQSRLRGWTRQTLHGLLTGGLEPTNSSEGKGNYSDCEINKGRKAEMEEEGRRGREAKSGGDRDKRERPWEERPVTEGRRHSKGLLIVIKSSQFSLGSMVLGWGLEPGFSLVGMMRRVT